MSSTPSKMIKLKSSDGETFEVDETAVLISQTIKHMIEDGCADSVIPVPNVTSEILRKVIEYCNKHAEDKVSEEDLEVFDAEYVQVDQKTLFEIILAANYLTIPCLLKLGCQTVANMTRGKTVQEIRNHFNIINDLTPEEEEQIRLENAWAFDHATQEEKTQGEQTQEEQTQEEQAEQA